MNAQPKALAGRIELLEPRITPSNILAVVAGHILKITGSAGDDHITITADAGGATFFVSPSGGDTVNGKNATVGFLEKVSGISVALSDGSDTLIFSNSDAPIDLPGSVTVTGGHGVKTMGGTDLTVGGNLTISYGDSGSGTSNANFTDLQVNGSMTVASKAGNTSLFLSRDGGGISSINKNFTVMNGVGRDVLNISDMNFGGAVTVNNGRGDAMHDAGELDIANSWNTNFPSQFNKGISVTFPDGASTVKLSDSSVAGNVGIHDGTAHGSNVWIDGSQYKQPASIAGSLTVTGTLDSIDLGTGFGETGMNIGKSFSVTGSIDNIGLSKVTILGATNIRTSRSVNGYGLFINDSLFAGAFSSKSTKTNGDELFIEQLPGTSLPTVFEKQAFFSLTPNKAATIVLAGSNDADQVIEFDSTFTVVAAPGSNPTVQADHLESPFGFLPILPT